MSIRNGIQSSGLLAMLLVSCTGCATQWCHLPDDCAYVFNHSRLGCLLDDFCEGCPLDRCIGDANPVCGLSGNYGCGVQVYDEVVLLNEPEQAPASRRPRVKVGPPPVPYQPPMPPKFLPVPARSVFSNVNPHAPMLERSQIEVGYGSELAFPAGD